MAVVVSGCSAPDMTPAPGSPTAAPPSAAPTTGGTVPEFIHEPVLSFDEAWAMAFLPDGRALVTERPGRLLLVDLHAAPPDAEVLDVSGVPRVSVGGQGGLGDVLVAPPDGSEGPTVYLSWVESGPSGTSGAVVGRATLDLVDPAGPRLTDLTVLWRQQPTVTGDGHFGHRLALSPDGRHLFITSGERQKQQPAQDVGSDLGKIIRLDLGTGSAEHWTSGHRNPLGLEFAPDGALWSSEMGPQGGDELNLIERGNNYGWPVVSNGSHYDGTDIPDHSPGDGFTAPVVSWNPSISPGSLLLYDGDAFGAWQGDAFLGALSGQSLVRVDLDGHSGSEAERWPLARIRVVEQDPIDGTIWLIEDGPGGRVIHVRPA